MAVFPVVSTDTSFLGPYVIPPGGKERTRLHYLSLAHWYESAKFLPSRPDLFNQALLSPSAKEVRKFAKSRQEAWRSDWNIIRHKVFISGMSYLAMDRPDLRLTSMAHADLVAKLADTGLPERFLTLCAERFALWYRGPRVATFGADQAPEDVAGRKMASVVDNQPTWTMVMLAGKSAPWSLHEWALFNFIPVYYIGKPGERPTETHLQELARLATQCVVFEKRGGKKSDALIQLLRAKKVPVTLELYNATQARPTLLS